MGNTARGAHRRARHGLAALLAALACLSALPAAAGASDSSATTAYVRADLRLTQGAAALLPRARAALHGVVTGLRTSCPAAAATSPQTPESTRLSNELIGALVLAAYHPGVSLERRFAAEVAGLRWSSGSLTRTIHTYAASLHTLAGLKAPDVCGDVRAWAHGGFGAASPTTVAFDARFMPAWVAVGELPPGLSASESGEARSLAGRARGYEAQLSELEAHAVEIWGEGMNTLELWP